jgi:hypothetical protein
MLLCSRVDLGYLVRFLMIYSDLNLIFSMCVIFIVNYFFTGR